MEKPILFFDGYCSICNALVDWVLARDRRQLIQFASLQGKTAERLIPDLKLKEDLNTVVYFRQGLHLKRSDAILALLQDLGGFWKIFLLLRIIPQFLRDGIYDTFAKYRYRIFGKRDTCRLPTEQERDRLLP